MSALLTAVLIPAQPHQPVAALTLDVAELPLLWAEVGGPVDRVTLLEPAGTLFTNAWASRFGLGANMRATVLAAAANPVWRGGTILGDAVLLGAAHGGVETSADPAYREVLLTSAGRFGMEVRTPTGKEVRGVLPPLMWSDPFAAYADGLRLVRGHPLYAVRIRPLG
ncbi:conserved exported hypothetical protein [Frankia canadensis]|uniref:DUF3846 domain-containing protein n=1 Tax=Frankia canadensis TaxID=1836972 RepID=A0A2I2KVU4_9ACTN|nr:conserved exported hypothetical protein [Frankia canadensis]SOU57065.1 conserved exported hypothetical protein [Frankia canadensis]